MGKIYLFSFADTSRRGSTLGLKVKLGSNWNTCSRCWTKSGAEGRVLTDLDWRLGIVVLRQGQPLFHTHLLLFLLSSTTSHPPLSIPLPHSTHPLTSTPFISPPTSSSSSSFCFSSTFSFTLVLFFIFCSSSLFFVFFPSFYSLPPFLLSYYSSSFYSSSNLYSSTFPSSHIFLRSTTLPTIPYTPLPPSHPSISTLLRLFPPPTLIIFLLLFLFLILLPHSSSSLLLLLLLLQFLLLLLRLLRLFPYFYLPLILLSTFSCLNSPRHANTLTR